MKLLACLLGAALLATACASMAPPPSKDNRVGTGWVSPPAQSLIVLLPAVGGDPTLAPGNALVLAQVHKQLAAAGYRVGALEAANHDEVWRQETDAVGGVFDPATGAVRNEPYGRAMSNLARRVCQQAGCAAVLRFRLVARTAELGGENAIWDGQRRSIPLSRTGGSAYRFSGTTKGLSVELLVVTAEGRLGFHTYGGASLPFRTNALESKLELRPELFDNDAEIADGVRLALAPMIPAR